MPAIFVLLFIESNDPDVSVLIGKSGQCACSPGLGSVIAKNYQALYDRGRYHVNDRRVIPRLGQDQS
jgi:hypothetical protein